MKISIIAALLLVSLATVSCSNSPTTSPASPQGTSPTVQLQAQSETKAQTPSVSNPPSQSPQSPPSVSSAPEDRRNVFTVRSSPKFSFGGDYVHPELAHLIGKQVTALGGKVPGSLISLAADTKGTPVANLRRAATDELNCLKPNGEQWSTGDSTNQYFAPYSLHPRYESPYDQVPIEPPGTPTVYDSLNDIDFRPLGSPLPTPQQVSPVFPELLTTSPWLWPQVLSNEGLWGGPQNFDQAIASRWPQQFNPYFVKPTDTGAWNVITAQQACAAQNQGTIPTGDQPTTSPASSRKRSGHQQGQASPISQFQQQQFAGNPFLAGGPGAPLGYDPSFYGIPGAPPVYSMNDPNLAPIVGFGQVGQQIRVPTF